jgi:hypothetical protein
VTGGGEPERGERPVHDGELPEVLAQPRRGQRRREEDRAPRRHRAGAEAIDEGADPRHERPVEEQAKRDDEREAAAIDAEIGHDRLEKGPDRVPYPGRDEDHQRKGRRHPPAIEDPRGRLTRRGHGRLRLPKYCPAGVRISVTRADGGVEVAQAATTSSKRVIAP